MIAIYMLLPGCNLGPFRAMLARMADRRELSRMKIVSQCREPARRVYYDAVFEVKKEIPIQRRVGGISEPDVSYAH